MAVTDVPATEAMRSCRAATSVASLFYLVPVVTALLAFLLFGERLDAISVAGMVICAGGVILANRGARPKPDTEI